MRPYLFLLLLAPALSYSQDVTVVRSKTGAFIEFADNSAPEPNFGNYWLTNNSVVSLQNAMSKAIVWAKINLAKKMAFEKEIIRFRSMARKDLEFYRKFSEEFSKESTVVFTGINDGSFKIRIQFGGSTMEPDYFNSYIEFNNIETIANFIQILQGKSGNHKIDDIFQ